MSDKYRLDLGALNGAAPQELLDWLVDLGYPLDFKTTAPFPAAWRRALAATWHDREDGGAEGETVDDYLALCEEEGSWS